MCQGNVMASTEVNHGFGIEFFGIVCYKISRLAESGKDIGFQIIHNHPVSSIPSGHILDPFGKVVSGSDNPLVFPTGGWIYITYEI
jgi:hypothetical protein